MEVKSNPSPQHGGQVVENPQRSGLAPDSPKGMTIDTFGQRPTAVATGRPVSWAGSICDAATPERRQAAANNAPSSGQPAGGTR